MMALTLAIAALCAAIWLVWIYRPLPEPETAEGPSDPYAEEVARFRAEIHDWTRRA